MKIDAEKFDKFAQDRADFSFKTFGTPAEHSFLLTLKKLQHELEELIENPDDEMEWSDCFLAFLDAAQRKGYSINELVEFASRKLEINKKRNWKKNSDGTFSHVK